MDTKKPWYSKLALILALLLPVYFMVAALGTKWGLWGWEFGLGTMTIGLGPIILGAVAIIAVLALILSLVRKPRRGWLMAAAALAVPVAIFAGLGMLRGQAESIPPIHDVTTDPADPPQFSSEWLARRESDDANPINDYATPLGELEPWTGERFAEIADKSHAQIMAESYSDLDPLPLNGASATEASAALIQAMEDMGVEDFEANDDKVEAVFSTFWFGFEDDLVARIGDNQIDFRSVSRVGLSDLGKNAERIRELRVKTAEILSE